VSETGDRILVAAARLFAERGYDGTSVRAICEAAETNVNAVSYHHGGKRALYQSVINRWGDERLASAERILGSPPKDATDLATRLLIFAEQTLAAHLAQPQPLIVLFTELQQGFRNCDESSVQALSRHADVLIEFLKAAQRRRLLRKGLDVDIVAGALSERLNTQVIYASSVEQLYGTSINDAKYRRHWCRQTIDLLLHGVARPMAESS